MFIAAAEMQAILTHIWAQSSSDLLISLAEINPEVKGRGEFVATQIFGVSITQLGILASLAFMWSVRHPKTKRPL
jgi:hypothetical protein